MGRDRKERRRASKDKEGRRITWRATESLFALTCSLQHSPHMASLHGAEEPPYSFTLTTSFTVAQPCLALCRKGAVGMLPPAAGGLSSIWECLTAWHAIFVTAPHSSGRGKSHLKYSALIVQCQMWRWHLTLRKSEIVRSEKILFYLQAQV